MTLFFCGHCRLVCISVTIGIMSYMGQNDETVSIVKLLYIAWPRYTGYMYVDVSHFLIRMGTLLVLSVAELR